MSCWHSTTELRPQQPKTLFQAHYRGFQLAVKYVLIRLDTLYVLLVTSRYEQSARFSQVFSGSPFRVPSARFAAILTREPRLIPSDVPVLVVGGPERQVDDQGRVQR